MTERTSTQAGDKSSGATPPLQGQADTEAAKRERLPRVLGHYAKALRRLNDRGYTPVDSDLVPTLERAIAALSESAPVDRNAVLDEVLSIIDCEPELPGDMPDEMWEAFKHASAVGDRDFITEAFRIVVRDTKRGIRERYISTAPAIDRNAVLEEAATISGLPIRFVEAIRALKNATPQVEAAQDDAVSAASTASAESASYKEKP